MVNPVLDLTLTKPRSRQACVTRRNKLWLSLASIAVIGLLISAFIFWPRSPLDLGVGNRLLTSGVLARWRQGDLIVLIRHEERCDRSSNPCQGPADGLTIVGAQAATALGRAFQTLGMENSDVLSSPSTRTVQTARFMFGKTRLSPGPLSVCGQAVGEEILTHKNPGRNLLLITHSACISDLERTLGFAHADATEYGGALFVQVTAQGKLKALGVIKTQDWPAALKRL